MNQNEAAIRAIKDRVAAAAGRLEESAGDASTKENYHNLTQAARELHRCADDLQNMLMRFRPRK